MQSASATRASLEHNHQELLHPVQHRRPCDRGQTDTIGQMSTRAAHVGTSSQCNTCQLEHRRSSIACMTAAVPPAAGQLVTSERGVCGGPLAFHYANLMSHTAFHQSLACVRILYHHVPALLLVCTGHGCNVLHQLSKPSLSGRHTVNSL
jgi:hypothetical protein